MSILRSAAVAVVAPAVLAPGALAFSYPGWSAAKDKLGIRGYIQQPTYGTVSGSKFIGSWIGLCGYSCSSSR